MKKNKITTLNNLKKVISYKESEKNILKKYLKYTSIYLGIFNYLSNQCKIKIKGEDKRIYALDINYDEFKKTKYPYIDIKHDSLKQNFLTSICIDINKTYLQNLKYVIETIKEETKDNLSQVFKEVRI